mmetsp:Transcript_27961/g.56313  ORF Transcript_27961/g.56313 Transcript_27961/m.56313 type:complete len:242 (+) Transcript_27961:159-884(+)
MLTSSMVSPGGAGFSSNTVSGSSASTPCAFPTSIPLSSMAPTEYTASCCFCAAKYAAASFLAAAPDSPYLVPAPLRCSFEAEGLAAGCGACGVAASLACWAKYASRSPLAAFVESPAVRLAAYSSGERDDWQSMSSPQSALAPGTCTLSTVWSVLCHNGWSSVSSAATPPTCFTSALVASTSPPSAACSFCCLAKNAAASSRAFAPDSPNFGATSARFIAAAFVGWRAARGAAASFCCFAK